MFRRNFIQSTIAAVAALFGTKRVESAVVASPDPSVDMPGPHAALPDVVVGQSRPSDALNGLRFALFQGGCAPSPLANFDPRTVRHFNPPAGFKDMFPHSAWLEQVPVSIPEGVYPRSPFTPVTPIVYVGNVDELVAIYRMQLERIAVSFAESEWQLQTLRELQPLYSSLCPQGAASFDPAKAGEHPAVIAYDAKLQHYADLEAKQAAERMATAMETAWNEAESRKQFNEQLSRIAGLLTPTVVVG